MTEEANKQDQTVEHDWSFMDDDLEYEDIDLTLDHSEQGVQLVTFMLGGEKYGLNILKVRELIRYTETTPVPNMPSFLKGVINLRGVIIPVLDMRVRFGMPQGQYDQYTVIIIVHVGKKLTGIVVDTVADVVFLAKDHIKPPPNFSTMVDTAFIEGMGQVRDELLILLDIDHILSPEELALVAPLPVPDAGAGVT